MIIALELKLLVIGFVTMISIFEPLVLPSIVTDGGVPVVVVLYFVTVNDAESIQLTANFPAETPVVLDERGLVSRYSTDA